MASTAREILSPVGEIASREPAAAAPAGKAGKQPVVGLLDNSKPNVSHFLAAVGKDMRADGYRTVSVTKPRSAGPCPEIAALVERCDYVVNAVAD